MNVKTVKEISVADAESKTKFYLIALLKREGLTEIEIAETLKD